MIHFMTSGGDLLGRLDFISRGNESEKLINGTTFNEKVLQSKRKYQQKEKTSYFLENDICTWDI